MEGESNPALYLCAAAVIYIYIRSSNDKEKSETSSILTSGSSSDDTNDPSSGLQLVAFVLFIYFMRKDLVDQQVLFASIPVIAVNYAISTGMSYTKASFVAYSTALMLKYAIKE